MSHDFIPFIVDRLLDVATHSNDPNPEPSKSTPPEGSLQILDYCTCERRKVALIHSLP